MWIDCCETIAKTYASYIRHSDGIILSTETNFKFIIVLVWSVLNLDNIVIFIPE